MIQDIINTAALRLQRQLLARLFAMRENDNRHIDFHVDGRPGRLDVVAHLDDRSRTAYVFVECRQEVGDLGVQIVTRKARVRSDAVRGTGYIEHMTSELRDLIEDAFWARGPAPSAPAPQVSASPLKWGEVRSAVGAADYRRLLELARHLVVKGEEADPVREYCRTALDAQRGLPWPVGYHVEAMGGQQPIERFLLPRDAERRGGSTVSNLLSAELRTAGFHVPPPASAYDSMVQQRHARDLYRLGLEPEPKPDQPYKHPSEAKQWELIHELYTDLTSDLRWVEGWSRSDVAREAHGWDMAQREYHAWLGVKRSFLDDVGDLARRLSNALVQLEAKPLDDVPLVVQRRIAGILRRGPTLNGLAYAAWALHAPLSWGDQAHPFGPAEDPNRIVVPEGSEGERWRVTGEIHRALGKLIDAVQEAP